MCKRNRLGWVVAFAGAALPLAAVSGQISVTPLPSPLPRTELVIAEPCGSTTPRQFDELGVPFINASSTIAFHARETWCSQPSPTYGIYALTSGNVQTTIAQANYDGSLPFTLLSVIPGINDYGDVSFRGTTPSGSTGVYARISSVVTPIALDGQPAPGLSGYTFTGLGPDSVYGVDTRRVLINGKRMVAFRGWAVRADPPDAREGIWTWTASGGLQLIIATGMIPPGSLNGRELWQLVEYDIDSGGRVAYEGGCPDPYPDDGDDTYYATWLGYPGGLTIVDSVPGQWQLAGPYEGGPFLNSVGVAGVRRKDIVDENCRRDLQRLTGGAVFIPGGDPAPGTSCLEWTTKSCDPLPSPPPAGDGGGEPVTQVVPFGPVVNDAGKTLTYHTLYDRDGDCTSPSIDGIWLWTGAASVPVAIDEQNLWNWTGNEDEYIETCQTGTSEVAINKTGQTAFGVTARRPSSIYYPFDYGTALFGRSAATTPTVRLIIREHDMVSTPTGSALYTISTVAWGTGEAHRRDNIRSGHGLLNDSGNTAYWAGMYNPGAGSRQVIYRTHVP